MQYAGVPRSPSSFGLWVVHYNKDDLKYMIDFSPDGEDILDYVTIVKGLCPICFSELVATKRRLPKDNYWNDEATHYCSNDMCGYKNIFN